MQQIKATVTIFTECSKTIYKIQAVIYHSHLIYSTLIIGVENICVELKKKMQYKNRFGVNILHQNFAFWSSGVHQIKVFNTYKSKCYFFIYPRVINNKSQQSTYFYQSPIMSTLYYIGFYQNKKDHSIQNEDKCKCD